MPVLGQNQYGKAENRVVRVTRDGATHHIKDLNVSVSLSGDMDEAHYSGSNANVLPTDTTRNTVYAFAKEHGIESAEQFGIHLARHFVTSQEPIHRARVRVEEHAWERIENSGEGAHPFVRKGQETRLAQITYDGEKWEVVSADGAVYFAADRPYGLTEATVLRDGREARIPVDLSNL